MLHYLFTDARLSLLKNCPGEDRPLHSTGDLTTHIASFVHRATSFSKIMPQPVLLQDAAFPFTPLTLWLSSPSHPPPASCPPHTPTSPQVSKHCSRRQGFFAGQLAFPLYHFLWSCSSKTLFLQWTEGGLLDQSLFLQKQYNGMFTSPGEMSPESDFHKTCNRNPMSPSSTEAAL